MTTVRKDVRLETKLGNGRPKPTLTSIQSLRERFKIRVCKVRHRRLYPVEPESIESQLAKIHSNGLIRRAIGCLLHVNVTEPPVESVESFVQTFQDFSPCTPQGKRGLCEHPEVVNLVLPDNHLSR